MYMEYNQGRNGLGAIDWNSIIKDVVGGYAAVKSVQTQADLVKAQTQAAQAQAARITLPTNMPSPLSYQLNPQYSPQYATPQAQQSNMMPILLIGGAAVLLLFLMKG